jgi:hypothetical protein
MLTRAEYASCLPAVPVQVERLTDPISPVSEILARVPSKQLMSVYKVATFDGVDSFLQQVANARGKLKRGGVVDVEVRQASGGEGGRGCRGGQRGQLLATGGYYHYMRQAETGGCDGR